MTRNDFHVTYSRISSVFIMAYITPLVPVYLITGSHYVFDLHFLMINVPVGHLEASPKSRHLIQNTMAWRKGDRSPFSSQGLLSARKRPSHGGSQSVFAQPQVPRPSGAHTLDQMLRIRGCLQPVLSSPCFPKGQVHQQA